MTSLLLWALACAGPLSQRAEGMLLVNEYLAYGIRSDDTGQELPADWFELYNNSDHRLDLEGFSVTDDPDDPDEAPLPLDGLSIETGGWLLLWADHQPELGPDHLDLSLASGGNESIALYAPDGELLDRVDIGEREQDEVLARRFDGAETWIFTSDPTPGGPNH